MHRNRKMNDKNQIDKNRRRGVYTCCNSKENAIEQLVRHDYNHDIFFSPTKRWMLLYSIFCFLVKQIFGCSNVFEILNFIVVIIHDGQSSTRYHLL